MTNSQQQQIFESWLQEHKGIFFKIVRSYSAVPQDQEDLFQEIAVNVWKSVPNFRNNCAVSTWIYRIALNRAVKWSLKVRKQQEREAWLYEQIQKLDEVDRSLCLLMLDGFSYKEMASIVGISESYVGVKINRIKKHLTEQSKKM